MKADFNNNEQSKFLYEYNEACSSYKHYSGLRFAEFSVFSALLVAIAAASFNYLPQQPSATASLLLRFGGLFLTLIFWAMEARAGQLVDHYLNRAREIELLLGLTLNTSCKSEVRRTN